MPPLIREAPVLSWPALQTHTVRVGCTLREGLSLTDYGTITLTVREDPLWDADRNERGGADKNKATDPRADGWPVSTTAVGAPDPLALTPTVAFTLTVPTGAGYRRYALDVVANGGVAGRVELVNATWLTVTPTLQD